LQKAPENTIHYTMQNNVEIIQINISGEDKPGMTSSLTEILARYDAFRPTSTSR
jgi:sensor histidine kinase YesM